MVLASGGEEYSQSGVHRVRAMVKTGEMMMPTKGQNLLFSFPSCIEIDGIISHFHGHQFASKPCADVKPMVPKVCTCRLLFWVLRCLSTRDSLSFSQCGRKGFKGEGWPVYILHRIGAGPLLVPHWLSLPQIPTMFGSLSRWHANASHRSFCLLYDLVRFFANT